MPVFKCKMCGGALGVTEGMTVCECEYCGTKQTLPNLDDEKRLNLYNRANYFRQQCAFDKAEQIYEKIAVEMPDEAEVHWSLVLCRYGVEYVEDPSTFERVPTCHRASYDSIFEDIDYLEAINKADSIASALYQKEAARIDRIQKGILEISQKEKPFDIFICYKENDSLGRRTLDSVKAQEIYDALTDDGYKVFFSRITLEDKLGQSYEPYIFAALNSAKVMLVVGTDSDNLNAVWVKNEWSRYLKILSQKKDRTLIPCYLNISPYELPGEFSYLQGQDMSKIGFMQDLLKGIGKLIPKSNNILPQNTNISVVDNNTVQGLTNLIDFAIGEQKWDKADNLCEQLMMTQSDSILALFYKLLIYYYQYKDYSIIAKKMKNLYPNISKYEISYINDENYVDVFALYLNSGMISRIEYIIEKHPSVIRDAYIANSISHNKTEDFYDYSTPLIHAISILQKYDIIKLLLECGANPNQTSRTLGLGGYHPALLINDIKCFLNINIFRQNSSLGQAIQKKEIKTVKLLLEYGADPNIFDNGTGVDRSMLSYAVINAKSVEIVKLLIEHGADPNKAYRIYTNKYGQIRYSPLSDAIWNAKNVEMVKLLLEHGADPNLVDNGILDDGKNTTKSMLSYAITDAKNVEMVELLLEHGADPNKAYRIYTNKYGQIRYSPLSDAIWNAKNVGMVKLLLKYGADSNLLETFIDNNGIKASKSLLTYAIVDAKSKKMVSLLIQHGATWGNKITYDGKTCLERKYPYQKVISKDFIKFLKTQGWIGSLF